MPNALIFSPGLDGHRQVYVFVMAQILEESGFNIFVAANSQEKILNSFYVNKLKERNEITFLDTSKYASGGLDITFAEFLALQDVCKADLTIFADASNHISLFISRVFNSKKWRGKIVGIFMRPFYYYRPKRLVNKLKLLKHFFSRWNTDEELFYKFFLKKFSLLDVSLCIDENFVNNNPNFKWLPDVFQQYAEVILKADEKCEQRHWIEKLKAFKEKNKDKFSFFYFGTAQPRRGYDILLKLAEETGGCFIHCGLRDNKAKFSYDTDKLISSLKNENRFFETNEYIDDPLCIEYFFRCVSHLILPYRNFFGSSGVMLQALEYGIPILAPDSGVMGYRIEKYHLGMTYLDSDMNSLITQLDKFKRLEPKCFENDIKVYMNLQSIEKLKKVLVNSFVSTSKSLNERKLQSV
jgi:hypothetical protein